MAIPKNLEEMNRGSSCLLSNKISLISFKVISEEENKIPYKHKIQIKDGDPVALPSQRISYSQREDIINKSTN